MPPMGLNDQPVSRRRVLQFGAASAAALVTRVDRQMPLPQRLAHQTPSRLPEIQFDIGDFLAPARTIDGIDVRFGPTYTMFLPARLAGTPSLDDQAELADALNAIEDAYAFAPSGVFTFVSYSVQYFRRLPEGLPERFVPHLLDDRSRFALEEAVVAPTDVAPQNPTVRKQTFNVPVRIETNDLLVTLRSDELRILRDVATWLRGSGRLDGRNVSSPRLGDLIRFDEPRLMFGKPGMPRQIADAARLPYATRVNPDSPMWMGFADQQVDASGPARIATFGGNEKSRLTDADDDSYFAGGSIQHFSHVILDLEQFYLGAPEEVADGSEMAESSEPSVPSQEPAAGEPDEAEGEVDEDETYAERVQYMFRSTPPPHPGYKDQLTDGGGPAFLRNEFIDAEDAERAARGIGTPDGEHRIGHTSALHRSSRTADGTPIHIRVDGPGFDAIDVPDRSPQPKLHFSIFVPTAAFFAQMRRNQAAVDLAEKHDVPPDDQGLERFITATRRQNFLVPPRSHRAFPLLEV